MKKAVMMMACVAALAAGARGEEDLFTHAPWSAGAGVGLVGFEGDEPVKPGFFLALRLGYDFNPHWTLEGDFNYAPVLSKRTFADARYALTDDTYMLRFNVDALLHLRHITRNLQWDPYLSIGAGVVHYGENLGLDEDSTDLVLTGGAGLMYHFNDAWALRADARLMIAGAETEFDTTYALGVNYRFGTGIPPAYTVTGGDMDSDGDGLADKVEPQYGTDPYDPDTDKDQLFDGPEVLQHKTNPLNPDSDMDGLKDGAEVLTYKTDPLNPDTDNGGVSDGHEVIEDDTNPLDPSDDLQLFSLNIEFDYDKAVVRPAYFDQLNKVIKVMQRDPGSTARVEGHADKRKHSEAGYNQRLSERRAKAVMDYMIQQGGIEASRLTAKGYGFDRPIAPNDTEANMQKNRRTDIYIRKGNGQESSTAQPMKAPEPVPTQAPGDLPVQ